MGRYTVDDHEFNTKADYDAALRDKTKIESLNKQGRNTYDIAKNYKEQIKRAHISFETEIGREFLDLLDEQTFTGSKLPEKGKSKTGKAPKNNYRISRTGKRIKRLTLIPLYILLILTTTVLSLWIYREYESDKELEKIKKQAAEEAAAETQPELPEPVEKIAVPTPTPIPVIMPQYKELHDKNPDMVGWLTIPDTKIDYPVMYKEDDNDYYLSHNFDGEDDVTGLLVLDKRCDPEGNGINCLIHGHNMKSGAMFGSLKKYADAEYCKEHPSIIFNTLYEERTYDIIAVFRSRVYDENTTDFEFYDYIQIDDEAAFDEYVSGACEQSIYDTGFEAVWGDKLITLSTCEYTRANGRLVIVGRYHKE